MTLNFINIPFNDFSIMSPSILLKISSSVKMTSWDIFDFQSTSPSTVASADDGLWCKE